MSELQEALRQTSLVFAVTRWTLVLGGQYPEQRPPRIHAPLVLKTTPNYPFELSPAPATGKVSFSLDLTVGNPETNDADGHARCGVLDFMHTKTIWELGRPAEDDAFASVLLDQATFDRIWCAIERGTATAAHVTLNVRPIKMKSHGGGIGATYTWDTQVSKLLSVLSFDVAFVFQKPNPSPALDGHDAKIAGRLENIEATLTRILTIQQRPLIDRIFRGWR